MCFELATHRTDCETRRISTLMPKRPEFDFDIYHPFEWPRQCEHSKVMGIGDVCPTHGNCCELSYRKVCVYWVGHGEGIIKCRGFNRRFHIIVPSNGSNDEVDNQFRDPVDDAVRLTEAEENRLHLAHLRYIEEGVKVRTILEDSGNAWITRVNPPYNWRDTFNTGANELLLRRFDAAERGWKRVCPTLKKEQNPLQSETMKSTQSEFPYWYKVLKVPRSGTEGPPIVGPESPDRSNVGQPAPRLSYGQFVPERLFGQPALAQSSASGAGGDGVAAADVVGGLINPPGGDQNGPVAGPDDGSFMEYLLESPGEYVPPSSSDGPTRIFSRSPGEGNDAGLEEDDEAVLQGDDEAIRGGDGEQGPPLVPAALSGLAPAAGEGNGLAGGHAQAPFGRVSGHGQLYRDAQAAVQALANPQWSVEQLSAMRDAIVQQPAESVRVENDLVGIPVTGMVWLPAEGLLNPSPGGQFSARFYLENVDDRGHHREPDALLRLPAGILWRLLNNVPRDIPQANLAQIQPPQVQPPQANLPQLHPPHLHPLEPHPPQLHIPQANLSPASLPQVHLPPVQPPQVNPPQVHLPPVHSLQANLPQVPPPQVHIPQANLSQANIRPEDIPVQSIEDENGDGPPWSPLADPGVPGGSGEGDSSTNTNTTRGSGGNQGNNEPLPPTQSPSGGGGGGEGESSTNTNTTRESSGNKENDEPLPPTQSPSAGQAQSSIQQTAPILVQSSPLQEPGNGADGSQQSGPLPPANPPSLQEGRHSQEGTTGLLSDGVLQEQENAPGAAGSSVSRKTRKRAAEEDDDDVEEEPAPPQPTRRQPTRRQPARRQPAKRRRVETPVDEPVDKPAEEPVEEPVVESRYKFRQRGKVNYKY